MPIQPKLTLSLCKNSDPPLPPPYLLSHPTLQHSTFSLFLFLYNLNTPKKIKHKHPLLYSSPERERGAGAAIPTEHPHHHQPATTTSQHHRHPPLATGHHHLLPPSPSTKPTSSRSPELHGRAAPPRHRISPNPISQDERMQQIITHWRTLWGSYHSQEIVQIADCSACCYYYYLSRLHRLVFSC
ncbi:hypothetical protein RHMOL_Rhmol01G0153400 [Rhododendron molle]|uniref:Uncharacterized protein n=1 Tax=Rhododendron molle TaxID=49168 RepID=A0ACC0Q217_RHOML|nr:hypothetical protein RHMOL_Rhmol01G0153400 [Rhododendron molle]